MDICPKLFKKVKCHDKVFQKLKNNSYPYYTSLKETPDTSERPSKQLIEWFPCLEETMDVSFNMLFIFLYS